MSVREPYPFKRGATFFLALSLPESVPIDYFVEGWDTPRAQIRKVANETERGYIADLEFAWIELGVSRQFTLSCENTDDWPLGLAELDILFTHESGLTARSKTATFRIKRGITQ